MKLFVKSALLVVMAALFSVTAFAQKTTEAKNVKRMKATILNAEEFREKVYDYTKGGSEFKFEGERPVVVDFFATWCGPCKMMSPVMDELAGEFAGQVDIYKVDVDKAQEVAAAFGVRSIPTFVFIPKEGQPRISTGAMGIEVMRNYINKELLGK